MLPELVKDLSVVLKVRNELLLSIPIMSFVVQQSFVDQHLVEFMQKKLKV